MFSLKYIYIQNTYLGLSFVSLTDQILEKLMYFCVKSMYFPAVRMILFVFLLKHSTGISEPQTGSNRFRESMVKLTRLDIHRFKNERE